MLLPAEQLLHHVATPADVAQVVLRSGTLGMQVETESNVGIMATVFCTFQFSWYACMAMLMQVLQSLGGASVDGRVLQATQVRCRYTRLLAKRITM